MKSAFSLNKGVSESFKNFYNNTVMQNINSFSFLLKRHATASNKNLFCNDSHDSDFILEGSGESTSARCIMSINVDLKKLLLLRQMWACAWERVCVCARTAV